MINFFKLAFTLFLIFLWLSHSAHSLNLNSLFFSSSDDDDSSDSSNSIGSFFQKMSNFKKEMKDDLKNDLNEAKLFLKGLKKYLNPLVNTIKCSEIP